MGLVVAKTLRVLKTEHLFTGSMTLNAYNLKLSPSDKDIQGSPPLYPLSVHISL
jgi:hypothetical protein